MSFIRQLTLENFLSFRGPATVELEPLNILIGANGTGKSNFIRAIGLLRTLPLQISAGIRELGSAASLLWAGASSPKSKQFTIGAKFDLSGLRRTPDNYQTHPPNDPQRLEYRIGIEPGGFSFSIEDERLIAVEHDGKNPLSSLFFEKTGPIDGDVVLNHSKPWEEEILEKEHIKLSWDTSLLSIVRGPGARSAMRRLSEFLGATSVYDRWNTSRSGPMRGPQSTEKIPFTLLPDGSNLALVVSHFESKNVTYQIEEQLKGFNPRIQRVSTSAQGNFIQIFFREYGLSEVVASSAVSDGTLQYLALLCVLLHPEPAPLICFEEPECGLHPDAIPLLAQLLRDASERMQIIVSTHSDRLVDCFSDKPECVLVTDRDEDTGETVFERLDRDELKVWLEKYRLGKLWTSGQIGGVIR